MEQTYSRIDVEGTLNSKEIITKDQNGNTLKDKNRKEYLRGNVEVKMDETNIVPISFFAHKFKKDGNENEIYKGFLTIKNEAYAADETENPNKVRISNGFIEVSEYLGNDEEVQSSVKYKTNFINRVKDDDPKAEFEVEIVIKGFRPEVVDEEETGDGFVDGYIVNYNGELRPLSLKVKSGIFEEMQDKVNQGEVVIFKGDIINSITTTTQTVEMDFGEDEERVIRRTKREITASKARYSDKEIESDDWKEMMEQRNKAIEAIKKEGYFGSKSNDKKEKEKEDDDDTDWDLPF